MQSRNAARLFVPLLAAFAVVYPSLGGRSPTGNPATATNIATATSAAPPGEPETQGFPTAKDLVARFLFSRSKEEASLPEKTANQIYSIEFLIATAPDPIDSRLPNFFDSFAESIGSAAEASGFTLDRFALPWKEERESGSQAPPIWSTALYDSVPGLILFRNPREQKLLLVFLIGETPTTGIHKQAMFSALDQMAQFCPWDSQHAKLPAAFPQAEGGAQPAPIRIMGPAFSGSAVSLRFVLDSWLKSRQDVPGLRFEIVSGTATAIDPSRFSQLGHGQASFHATVPPDHETLQAVACYIQQLGYPRIAILTERNTTYGQNLAHDIAAGEKGSSQPQMSCRDAPSPPHILDLPFPLHISNLREAAALRASAREQAAPGSTGAARDSTPLGSESTTQPREILHSFSDLTVQSAQLTLSNLLSTIARERYSYVGIVATDVRDATFLAREVRRQCPATVLFTLNSDLLYAQSDVNQFTRGMLVITPYPLFNLEQLWTYPYRGAETRLQFSSQAAEGVYNATLALLHRDDKMVDYGGPLPKPTGAPEPGAHKPSLWVTAIGNRQTLPISLLKWEDDRAYTYSPTASAGANDAQSDEARKPNVGPGLYNENVVVVVIVLSLLFSSFSLLIVSQYGRSRKKKRSERISALLGDAASHSYWFEGRLFLFCFCTSLLAFYIVVTVDFCLPLIAGWELGRSVETSLTPKIALVLLLVTILLLFLAARALVSACCAAPAGQKGSAPEVTLFALFGCGTVFILAGFLVASWYETVKRYPASGLFSFLRSFDLQGGLSPLLPLACVAAAACLWSLCSFRRLRMIDILRASASSSRGDRWLSFLPLEGRSFMGVRELENNIKFNLESASVLSTGGYSVLLAVALMAGHYFFDSRLVQALEARPFYWVFEAAFFIVYWALFTEMVRLVLTWRGLHLLLQRLSWHPLHAAFARYHQRFSSGSKLNLAHAPSSFGALESSVEQAGLLLRSARNLLQAADTPPDLRVFLQQLIPEWEVHLETAESEQAEALKLEWTDPTQPACHSAPEPAHKRHAARLKGDWRQSLRARRRAQHALFQLMESLLKPIEQHWLSGQAAGVPELPTAFFQQAEEFIVSRVVNFLVVVFPSLQNLGYFVLVGLLLMLLAVTSYPFQPRNEFLFFNWVVILAFIGTVFWIFTQMDRDTVLSLLNGTKPGQVSISRELVLRTFLYIGAPLLALFGAQFPESVGKIISLFTTTQGGG